ncbi:hypothetical protein LQL77_32820, partial [Rhodococcus cerastii]|nr:hypothetical protein [Rhodococcus cerastii]
IEQIPARGRTTGRLRSQMGAAIGAAARSVTEVAAAHFVSWPTAHRASTTAIYTSVRRPCRGATDRTHAGASARHRRNTAR